NSSSCFETACSSLSEFAGDFWYGQRCRNSSTTCCPPTTRGIGMSLWIVLGGLLIMTLPRNMGAGLDVLLDFFENGHPQPRSARPEVRPLVTILALFFWFYRSPNFVSMRWSQVFSYVFPSFASLAIFGSNSVRLPKPILGSRSGAIRSSIHSTGPTRM